MPLPAEFEQFFPWIAVPAVLRDCVVNSLLGEVVLQFEGDDRQAVDFAESNMTMPSFLPEIFC